MTSRRGSTGATGADPESAVMAAVRRVVAEMDRRHHARDVSLDSRMAADLGLDSLAVAEVLSLVGEELGVSLPSGLIAGVETPRDLVRAVGRALRLPAPVLPPPQHVGIPSLADGEQARVPGGARTLVEVLERRCDASPDQVHIRLLGDEGEEEVITYSDLRAGAVHVAGGMLAAGLPRGGSAALMLPTGRAYFEAFMGVLLAGGVPVPIYPPARPSQIEEHVRRHARILSNARVALLVTDASARPLARLVRSSVETVRAVVTVDDLPAVNSGERCMPLPDPDDTALIQYTSGSTGDPKGVVLTHAELLSNIAAMAEAVQVTPGDAFVSWLPLYHDMGLIGAWLAPLCLGFPTVIMSPLTFLAAPVRWLSAIGRFRGSLTAAPNFAYELCLRHVDETDIGDLDLSSLRMALNGAEPIRASTMEGFAARFTRCGLRPGVLAPVYGLAECALALTFPPRGREVLVDTVDGGVLRRDGRAVPVGAGRAGSLRVVACGQPLPGYEVRVVDRAGREQPERREGGVEFRGPSATSGYFHNPEATAALFHDGWVVTGDLGYQAGGDLYLTGRAKDLIIRAGRNLHPEELEAVVGDLPGVRKGCVAAFAAADPRQGTEKLVVIAETRETDPAVRDEIRGRIVAATVDFLGEPPDDIVLAPAGTVLKTSSGKIRRAATSDLYELGRIGARPVPVWWQLVRLAWSGLPGWLRRQGRDLTAAVYAGYCWALFVTVAAAAMAALVVVPRRSWRQHVVRGAARCLRVTSGTRLTVRGAARLPAEGSCVVVANHASWLDAPLLASWLPAHYGFVAGEVFGHQRLVGFLLHRIGTEFVERHDPGRAVTETGRLGRLATTRPLVFFPEGGLDRATGLRPFHMGAFVAATRADRPIVPVAIIGTRTMLRPGQRMIRRGRATLMVGEPIQPDGSDWSAALRLQQLARREILRHCHEPDLQ